MSEEQAPERKRDEYRPWHRLFGMGWTDFFSGTGVVVEMEKDLSLKKQFLDIVIIRKDAAAPPGDLPDGFEALAEHNLVSFKSFHEPLDCWALKELGGHFVNYRKQASPNLDDLLPESDFRLFAVCVRVPQELTKGSKLRTLKAGVHEVDYFDSTMRLIVIHDLPQTPNNAMLHLFSRQADLLTYGGQHYRPRSQDTSTFLSRLYARYQQEGFAVPYTYEEGMREAREYLFSQIPVEQRLEGVPVEKLLERVPVEKLLERVPVEMRLEGVPVEMRLEGVPAAKLSDTLRPEDLTPEQREELIRRLQAVPPREAGGAN